MAKYSCPSCGSPYDGKRCRNCLYEHFTEEISHGNHTHEGEPLVVESPVRKPIRRKNPFGCEKRPRKKHPLAGFLVLLVIINGLLPMLRNWGLELEARKNSFTVVEPEPMVIPEDAMTLYADDALRILADWKNGQEYTDGIRIFVENYTGSDLTVRAEDIIVNGYMMDTAYFYCDVRDGTHSLATLRLDEDALDYAGISVVEAVSFQLEVWEQDTHDPIATSSRVVLQAGQAGAGTQKLPEGQLLYDQDGITISFLGYREDEYHPEDVSEGAMLFHIQNNTDRYLQVYSAETILGGETVDTDLWCQLYPGTRAVSTMYLYALEDMGFLSQDDLFPAQVALEITDRDDYSFFIATGWLALPAP